MPSVAADPVWNEYYRDEMDAAWLYRTLAGYERDPARRAIFERLVTVEEEHVQRWRGLFQTHGGDIPSHTPSLQTRAPAWTGRVFGSSTVLPIIVRQESREVGSYLRLAQRSHQKSTQDAAMAIATESAEHAQNISKSMGREGEPWHATAGSGYLRSVVYGFNDGLTANFGLVAGMIGADVAPHLVIVTGVAGALADALSMGSSGYLAAKSDAEMAARQIAIEKEEMRLMPDLEEAELAVILEAKGLAPARARESAHAMMRDPARALDTKVQEELGLQTPSVTRSPTASSPGRPRLSARSSRWSPFSRWTRVPRSGSHSRSPCWRTSPSGPRAASSPAAVCGPAAVTCSSSASAWRPRGISSAAC